MSHPRVLVWECPSCHDYVPIDRAAAHLDACTQTEPWKSVKEYLSANGPTQTSQLNARGLVDSRGINTYDIETFHPHGLKGSGNVSYTAYLPTHSPGTVIRTWVRANEEQIRNTPRSTITRRIGELYSDEWTSAWKAIADEFGFKSHQRAPSDAGKDPLKICPICGEEVSARQLPNHLSTCN